MISYRTREKLKTGPLAPVYASLRRLMRSLQPGYREKGVFASWEDVPRPNLEALEQTVQERPQEPRLHFTLALEHLEQGRPEQALTALTQCASLHFEAEERMALHTARALARLGRVAEAQALIAGLKDHDLTQEEAVLRDQVRAATQDHPSYAAS
jgi:thioredoxin-like negative regulator of GroEL